MGRSAPASLKDPRQLTKLVKQRTMEGMATQVNIYEAKTHLSSLLERAAAGEEIVVAKAGRPLARIVPLATAQGPRQAGAYRGQLWIAEDFDELPEQLAAAFRSDGS